MIYKLDNIPVADDISPEDFNDQFVAPAKPVILRSVARAWGAYSNWNYNLFREKAGNITVPLYNNIKSGPDTIVNTADEYMKFGDYLSLIESQPTQLRIFLFNIFKHVPELCKDFNYPDHLLKGFLKKYPMMFFGGAGSIVHLHYDMDLSHILLTQFQGKKKVILFAPEESAKLYRMPFMVQSFIDVRNPDLNRHPRLKDVQGYECDLEHGDTLFIPSGYWHYMEYTEGGYALALRAMPDSYATRVRGVYNLTVMRKFDDMMKKIKGADWFKWKESKAFEVAARA